MDEQRAAERREDAALVERARADDPDAFGQLYDRWFDRVHDLAFRVTNDAAAASDVAQDALLAAWQKLGTLQDPEAFGGWLLRITRNAALDRRRREDRARPYDSEGMSMIESSGSPAGAPAGFRVEERAASADDPERAAEDAELTALVWESAGALGERDAEVLDLMLRHGLAPAEIGEVVGLNRNAANQAVHRARSRLKTAIEARVLWRSGEPVCAALVAALESAGVKRFGPEAMRLTTAHAETCQECQQRRQTKLEPSRMFAMVPMIAVSVVLKQKVAHALSDAGVPMDGSEALPEGGPSDGGSPRSRRWRRVGKGAGVAVGGMALVVILGSSVDEVTLTAPTSIKTTTLAATTTVPTEAPTTVPTVATTVTTKPRVVVAPPIPPPLPPPASASITATSPVPRSSAFTTVSWNTSNGASVQVSGPNLSSSAPSGTVTACAGPGGGAGGCFLGAPVTYTVTVYDSGGNVVAQQSATVVPN